jgi:hypothetical protein
MTAMRFVAPVPLLAASYSSVQIGGTMVDGVRAAPQMRTPFGDND